MRARDRRITQNMQAFIEEADEQRLWISVVRKRWVGETHFGAAGFRKPGPCPLQHVIRLLPTSLPRRAFLNFLLIYQERVLDH